MGGYTCGASGRAEWTTNSYAIGGSPKTSEDSTGLLMIQLLVAYLSAVSVLVTMRETMISEVLDDSRQLGTTG